MARTQQILATILILLSIGIGNSEALSGTIQCDSVQTSYLSSAIVDDYWFNISTDSDSTRNHNWASLDVEFITEPSIPIDIYYPNTTLYQSCFKTCVVRQTPLSQSYIIRLSRFLRADRRLNYTLSVHCREAYIETTLALSTTAILETEFKYSVSFDQSLTFQNIGNILSFAACILIVLAFIMIGLYLQRDSKRDEIRFLVRSKYNAVFYICAVLTLPTTIIMCSAFPVNKAVLGVEITLTMCCINSVAVMGICYYPSLIRNIKFKNGCFKGQTLAMLCRVIAVCLAIFYLVFYYVRLAAGEPFLDTVLFITYVELAAISIASLSSKTAQVQWCILFILIAWLHDSTVEEIFFDFYWYSMFCVAGGLFSIFLFANNEYAPNLRHRFWDVSGAFLSIFDITTDLSVMVLWVRNELYFWTVMQLTFIFFGTIYSAFYIDDYYFIADEPSASISNLSKETSDAKKAESDRRAQRLLCGRILTFFGLGRVYHGILGWDDRNKDMEISNRVLKVWEMIFESFPTLCLQTWVSLYTNLDITIVLSLFVGLASLTYTFFSVLYGDHVSPTRAEEHMIASKIHSKRKITGTVINRYDATTAAMSPSPPPPLLDVANPASNNHLSVGGPTTSTDESQVIKTVASTVVDKSLGNGCCDVLKNCLCTSQHSVRRNFICWYPIEYCLAWIMFCKTTCKEEEEAEEEEKKDKFTTSEKSIYWALYAWVLTDFGIRIFPILVCAWLRQQYLEFLLVMLVLTVVEFIFYYHMLAGDFKTPRSALQSFWTLYFTISYCLLSCMHVVYLPNNVVFEKLFVEHGVRMFIQAVFMALAMIMQNDRYDDPLGFFKNTIIVFWCAWGFNWLLTIAAYKGFYVLEPKIKLDYNYDGLQGKTMDNMEAHIQNSEKEAYEVQLTPLNQEAPDT